MTDIYIKTPDTRNRWWTIPKPAPAYKAGWDRIFGKKEKQNGETEAKEKPAG